MLFNGWEPGKTWYSVPRSLEIGRGLRWLDSIVAKVLTLSVTGLYDLSQALYDSEIFLPLSSFCKSLLKTIGIALWRLDFGDSPVEECGER